MDHTAADVFAPLIAAADRFPNLRHLFVGDIEAEQFEISWIHQSDLTPLLRAFPDLLTFGVRGSENLGWEQRAYPELRELTFQSGGLPPEVVRAVAGSEFPELTTWSSTSARRSTSAARTSPTSTGILDGDRLPEPPLPGPARRRERRRARRRRRARTDRAHLKVLDLSLGTLGDEGPPRCSPGSRSATWPSWTCTTTSCPRRCSGGCARRGPASRSTCRSR